MYNHIPELFVPFCKGVCDEGELKTDGLLKGDFESDLESGELLWGRKVLSGRGTGWGGLRLIVPPGYLLKSGVSADPTDLITILLTQILCK